MINIVTIPHPALRKVSKPVAEKEFGTVGLHSLLKDLTEALATRSDGVGISAPQIAVNKRIFVVSGRVFDKDWMTDKTKVPNPKFVDEYFINPVILKVSKKLAIAEEGCLSIPETYGMVKRPHGVSIEYVNEKGERKTKRATGLLARIFQHEIDHLDGVLFTDKATDIKKMKDTHENREL